MATSPKVRVLAITHWVMRVFIGGLVASTAIGKALDIPGFVEVLASYQAFRLGTLWPLALFVIVGEFVLAAWILGGWRLRWGAGVSAFMHAGYAGFAVWTLARGILVPNCGCFGVFLKRPLDSVTVIEDLVMVGLSLLLLVVVTIQPPGELRRRQS